MFNQIKDTHMPIEETARSFNLLESDLVWMIDEGVIKSRIDDGRIWIPLDEFNHIIEYTNHFPE